jgi:hypothetical protein
MFFFFFFFLGRGNIGERESHRSPATTQRNYFRTKRKKKKKKKKGRYAQQQNYAMKDITYIQAQIQSPLSITEFSILVNLSVAISGDARLRFVT